MASLVGGVSRSAAYKAASDRKPHSLAILREFWRQNQGSTKIDQSGNTILHFLAINGNVVAIRELLQNELLTSEQLKTCNVNGDTALHEAARFGCKDVAEVMLEKEGDLILARNNLGETPIYLAAAYGKGDVFNLLRTKLRGDCLMRRRDGCSVLHAAIMGENYSLAVSILESYPNLADKRDEKGMTALNLLASKPLSFRSGSLYMLRNLGSKFFIYLEIIKILIYICIPPMAFDSEKVGDVEDPPDCGHSISKLRTLFFKLISGYRRILRACAWIEAIDDAKQKHVCAVVLAKRLIKEENNWIDYLNYENLLASRVGCFRETPSQNKNRLPDPLIQATEHGIIEIVMEILKKFPDAATTRDENGRNILQIAAQRKNIVLYDYLKKAVTHTDRMLADVDCHGNTILHLAANKDYFPRVVFGATSIMTWDVFWFKHVKNDSHPYLLYHRNSNAKTAKELFEENHSEVLKQAEKSAKEISSGLMLVSTLIGTVNYAAIFTIPGGFDQNKGLPIFFTEAITGQQDLQLFLVYTGGSLFASLAALGAQLSIQLSRFDSNDFYISLPTKFLIATTSLFYSTGFSIAACFQVYILENALKGSYFSILGLACYLLSLVYINALYLTFNYLYYVIRYSLAYRRQKM